VTMIILVVEVLPPPRLASQLFGSRLVSTSPQIIVTEKQTIVYKVAILYLSDINYYWW